MSKRCFQQVIRLNFTYYTIMFTLQILLWGSVSLASVFNLWGFWAHRFINRMAVYRLPPEMGVLFKPHIDWISDNAVNPDRRRYSVVGEAERHFIDLDSYGDSAAYLPRDWKAALARYGEDSLRNHGIAPWHLERHLHQLTDAFRTGETSRILRLAADLGHYVADIHVPLHTTRNYNGQLTGQEGIHAFWETRLPELYATDYEFWIGPVRYIEDPRETIWQTILETHAACDSVLSLERKIAAGLPPDRQYVYELRNNALVKVPTPEFSRLYHRELAGQVERQMKKAIQLTGDLWYSCWVNAGQPVLPSTISTNIAESFPDTTSVRIPGVRMETDYE